MRLKHFVTSRVIVQDYIACLALVDHGEMLQKRPSNKCHVGLTPSSQMNACKPTMDCKIQIWNMNLCEMYVDGVRPMSPRCNLLINNWKIQARREIGINTTLACACID